VQLDSAVLSSSWLCSPGERLCLLEVSYQIERSAVQANVGVDLHVTRLKSHDLGIRGPEMNPASSFDDARLKMGATTSQACFFFCHSFLVVANAT
jgi:hypothetical protein